MIALVVGLSLYRGLSCNKRRFYTTYSLISFRPTSKVFARNPRKWHLIRADFRVQTRYQASKDSKMLLPATGKEHALFFIVKQLPVSFEAIWAIGAHLERCAIDMDGRAT